MQYLGLALQLITATSLILPTYLATILVRGFKASPQQLQLLQSFSLLLLGAALSTLATLNFSLAFVVGILASPLSFVRPLPTMDKERSGNYAINIAINTTAAWFHAVISPPVVLYALTWYWDQEIEWALVEIAKGWAAQGVYTSLVVWTIWWPAWVLAGVVLFSGVVRRRGN